MRTKVTLVLIFLNVALFFFIFKFERHWRTEAASLEARRRVLGAETADIRSITVTNTAAPGGSYSLERRPGGWSLTSPLDWPANPPAVNAIVTELQLLEHETSFAVKGLAKIGQTPADYGLDKPKLTIAFTSGDPAQANGPPPPTILRIGDSSKDGSRLYVLSPNGEVIHVVNRSLADRLTQPLDQLRADTLLSIPVFEARSLSVQTTAAEQPARGTAGGVRVRVRKESGSRWTFDTPITARASKTAVEVVITTLNGLHPKTFDPPKPAILPSAAPVVRIVLEGNGRLETLFLGEAVGGTPPAADARGEGAAPASKPAPAAVTEYYAQLENRLASLFTVVVPNDLIEKLRNAPEKLRETQILDFDRQGVTSITLAAPAQEITLQRLEAAANSQEGAAWQVVRRGEGSQGLQTTPADRAAVTRLLDQLNQLAATAFVSDSPSSAELENWGFNRPEREITLTLANPGAAALSAAPGASPAAPNNTRVLRLGTDGRGQVFARVGAETGASVYAVTVDLARDFPVESFAWRDRVVPLIPPNARVTALKLTDLPAHRVAFEAAFDAGGQLPAGVPHADAVQKLARSLAALHVKRFRAESFSAEARPWKYQLDVTFAAPASATAEQTDTRTLFLSERLGGGEQLGGAKELNLVFEIDQALLDALFPLDEGRRDPGPPPEPKK